MKKVINGSLYNTDTANCVGSWSNNLPYNDFGWCEESLYRTKSGKYFLHGEGGAMSIYCVHSGNSTCGGERIKPLTYVEAKQWAEENLPTDEYLSEFGTPEETETTEMHIYLSAAQKAKLDRIRTSTGKPLNSIVCDIINQYQE